MNTVYEEKVYEFIEDGEVICTIPSLAQIVSISSNKAELRRYEHSVYFLVKDEEVVYIGYSGDPIHRILTHRGSKDFDKFLILEMFDKELAFLVEQELIFECRPVLNKLIPKE